jgi:hypothetical protein
MNSHSGRELLLNSQVWGGGQSPGSPVGGACVYAGIFFPDLSKNPDFTMAVSVGQLYAGVDLHLISSQAFQPRGLLSTPGGGGGGV